LRDAIMPSDLEDKLVNNPPEEEECVD